MLDNLAIIERVIEEHRKIYAGFQTVGQSVSDLGAIFSLQQAYSGWTLGSPEALVEKQRSLQETMERLGIGLNNHFAFEEHDLPPLFGPFLMQALLVEHAAIREEFNKTKSMLAGLRLAGMDQPGLLKEKQRIQQAVDGLRQTIEEHAAREETILNMLKKALTRT